jgi:hypothetical protein
MSEETKNLSVSLEETESDKWSIVLRLDGEEDQVYPVESFKQGKELVNNCIPLIMPIISASAMRGEYVSFKANMEAAG